MSARVTHTEWGFYKGLAIACFLWAFASSVWMGSLHSSVKAAGAKAEALEADVLSLRRTTYAQTHPGPMTLDFVDTGHVVR